LLLGWDDLRAKRGTLGGTFKEESMDRGLFGSPELTRRNFLLLGASAGAGFVLAGCGGGPQDNPATQGSSGGDGGKTYDGPKVGLAFWNGFTGGDGPFMRQLVEQFGSENEKIDVSMNTIEWADYYQKVPAAVQSGQGPDVGIMHVDQLATNAARGVIVPLDDVAKSLGLQQDDFAPEVWQAGVYNNQRYGIPLDMFSLGFFYNRTVMEKGGLDPNNPPRTRDDYMAALEELKGKGIQGHWVSPFRYTGGLSFQSLLWQFGGDLYNSGATKATFNSDAGVEALTWLVDLINKGYSAKNVAQDAEYIAFQNGENAFMWNGPWNINPFKEIKELDWGVTQLPLIGSEKATWASSHNFVIMNNRPLDANKVQASKVFINWISQRSIEWAKAGQVPARKSVRNSQEFGQLQEQAQFADQLSYLHFLPAVPGIGDVVTIALEPAINEAVLMRQEPKAALDEAASKADQFLEENRQKYQAS